MTILLILLISFFASLVRSTLGFGESLIAVPLFLLFLPVEIAVPLSVMLSIVIALIIVIQDHSKIHFKSAKMLILSAIPGIPIGLLILIYGNEVFIKMGLGCLIILYSIYILAKKELKILNSNHTIWGVVCGFLSGILGGAYGLNGPPLVVYGHFRKWSTKHFRATLQAYFLPASFFGFVGYYLKGFVTMQVNYYFLTALITTIPAVFLGRYLNKKINNDSFYKFVYSGLIIIGLILIINTF